MLNIKHFRELSLINGGDKSFFTTFQLQPDVYSYDENTGNCPFSKDPQMWSHNLGKRALGLSRVYGLSYYSST